jgi:hypothetical protein
MRPSGSILREPHALVGSGPLPVHPPRPPSHSGGQCLLGGKPERRYVAASSMRELAQEQGTDLPYANDARPGRDLSLPPMRRLHRGRGFTRAGRSWARPRFECDPVHTSKRPLLLSRSVMPAHTSPVDSVADRSAPVRRNAATVRRRGLSLDRVRKMAYASAGKPNDAAASVLLVFPWCSPGVVFAPQQSPRIVRRDGLPRR